MNYIMKLFFKSNNSKNVELAQVEEMNDVINVLETNEPNIKIKKIKKCSFCKQTNHNVRNCEQLNEKFEEITNHFKNYENKTNIPSAKEFLILFDKFILNKYIKKYNINNFMYYNCSIYYDNNINNKNKTIELIIGYLCVLPLHPEIKIKRVKKEKKQTTIIILNNKIFLEAIFKDIWFYIILIP
jgi:hypothetical protein